MKSFRNKIATEYDFNDPKSLARLQKRAKFTYIDLYKGKKSKQFKRFFKRPEFQKFLVKYNCPYLVVAQIATLNNRGLGVLATEDLHIGKGGKPKPLGIYWGELSLEGPHRSHYVFVVSRYEIDANKYGNWTRFVNHSKANYNVAAFQKTFRIGKVSLPYIEYALIKDVKAGQQLLVDYGPEYEFDKKHQIFLNPSNSSLRSADIYASNSKHYMPIKGKLFTTCKELMPDAKKLFGPTLYSRMLKQKGDSLSQSKSYYVTSPELPILRADSRKHILGDDKQDGITALMLAAYVGNANVVRSLIHKYNANIEQQNTQNGYNALYYAIQSKCKPMVKNKIVRELVESGIYLETQDKEGLTALHWCVKQENLRLLELIFTVRKAKSNAMEALDMMDRENLCPITYAISRGQVEIAEYLLDVFKRYYKETFFRRSRNDWFLPTIKKIIRNCPEKVLFSMCNMLMKKGLDTNRKALKILAPILKTKGIVIQFKRK